MKVLIDTNVILDAILVREPWAAAAQELLRAVATDKISGYITASQTTDIFYILRRQGADGAAAKEIILKLTKSVKMLDVTPGDVERALASDMLDYEDALLDCRAKRHKAEYIVTRNEKDFELSQVKAMSPTEFMKQVLSVQ